MRFRARHLLLISTLLAPVLTGCGPGFPIMTGEQETLVGNVDRLVKENKVIKERLDALEGGGGGGGGGLTELRDEVAAVRSSIADTNSSLEDFRQEFSFVQGGVEEAEQKRAQFKESVTSLNASIAALDQRLAALEAQAGGPGESLSALSTSVAAAQNQLDNLTTSLSMLDKRTAALEEKVAKAPAVAPAQAKKAAATGVEPPEDMYLRGYKETKANNFAEASKIFTTFLSTYPDHKLASNSQYWLAEIYYARADWEMAILEFDKVIKKYPESEKVPAATLKQGYAFEKLGANKEAKVLLEQVVSKFPKSPEAGLAKKRLKSMK